MSDGLQAMIISYLEDQCGWYFDWDHINEVWGLTEQAHGRDPHDPLNRQTRAHEIRTLNGWTLPQWGEYWMKPYADDPTHENYGAPKTRRYECLKDALWSQLLREEEPGTYGVFFGDAT